MPLPAVGRQMQVELCEIPSAGAFDILCRDHIYAFRTALLKRKPDILS